MRRKKISQLPLQSKAKSGRNCNLGATEMPEGHETFGLADRISKDVYRKWWTKRCAMFTHSEVRFPSEFFFSPGAVLISKVLLAQYRQLFATPQKHLIYRFRSAHPILLSCSKTKIFKLNHYRISVDDTTSTTTIADLALARFT